MRRAMVPVLALGVLMGGAPAMAGPGPSGKTTSICLDVDGRTLPVVCRVVGGRLGQEDVFCQCPEGMQVEVSVCGAGQQPQAENRAFERARKALARDGSLIGDAYQGRAICVDPRRP